MLNKAPIFINGFQRGGTNILLNLIVSHPDVCMLHDETQAVFYGKNDWKIRKWIPRFFSLPIVLTSRQHTFWPTRLYTRNKLPLMITRYIDVWLFLSKLLATENRLRSENQRNSWWDIAVARLLSKNVNGVVLATPIFAEMYPDARFVGLVRNGLAICEGYVRRGGNAARIGQIYERVCQQMLDDSSKSENYIIIRFEDLIDNPQEVVSRIYKHLDLDIKRVERFRLQAKPSMNKAGARNFTFGGSYDREILWFSYSELGDCFRKDVNDNQISRLKREHKDIFLKYASESMSNFGYHV